MNFFLFGAELISLIKIDGDFRPIGIDNTLRHIASKCAASKALPEQQKIENLQVRCGTKQGAEKKLHTQFKT